MLAAALIAALLLAACGPGSTTAGSTGAAPQVLRLATTTSTADSGLLDAILPAFEAAYDARVDVVAVGTGQALALGERGDADVLLVHALSRELAFVEAGFGTRRLDVMYNDFILVGPAADPAQAAGTSGAAQALRRIAESQAPFASRGDDSGTHAKELSLWAAAGLAPSADLAWYLPLGQGMGETLQFANERGAYTLTDRATWLSQRGSLASLRLMFGGESINHNPDAELRNPYGVIPVNPAARAGINHSLAEAFAEWITSLEGQQLIAGYGQERFGQALFYPDSPAWKAANP